MPSPRKFVVLDNRDLAIINGSTGLTRQGFTNRNVTAKQTVTFDTTNPCMAIMDNDGVQWDLNSKRVWYSGTQVTIDLTDILYAKGLITVPAQITTITGTYKRDRTTDTASGYSWVLLTPTQGASNVPTFLYTKAETPTVGDPAYYAGTTTGASMSVQSVTNAIATPITGSWDAIFAVSTESGGGGGGGGVGGIEYDIIRD